MEASHRDELARRLAIIGCGAVVEEVYALELNKLSEGGWTLLFVDADTLRARGLASSFRGAEPGSSLVQVSSRVRQIIVAPPPASHFAICSQWLGAGIHVLCEKPFVLN